jgi:hypothetical protein
MKNNMGMIDKVLRVSLAVVVGVLIALGELQGTAAIVLGIFAAIFLITSLVGFCPVYTLVGLNTCPAKKK